ncbi:hypothetical protein SELMODRAFT_403683 [Selaginella moellendorffii]|uniref:Bet v I/Major latex protein domain-containing protein n=1 Tax=Selaginella moellendorffii TaxID=88036 RepID=D8QS71_SELML|nr:uncharacterized protein LOC9630708 [Selaginella moellendorffii]EFJ36882.1 hypothetical protein SELMODRAFT_403683 [Selaginella moellendorffii]|eukprot:XP_002961622.1 uncharacterized protein LOC9630708 [Selaginella moellendorffii]
MAKWNGTARGRLAAPIEKVWKITSNFGGLMEWSRIGAMRSCEISEGENGIPGCVRKITAELPDSGGSAEIHETLLELDDENHVLRYTIQAPAVALFDGLRPTLKLLDRDGSTEIEWGYEVDADPADPAKEQRIAAAVLGFYSAGIENLKKIVE